MPAGDRDEPSDNRQGGVGLLERQAAAPDSSVQPDVISDADMRLAQVLLFFAYRDFTNSADEILAALGLGRAHHRALHFIGRNPGTTVTDLLAILRITKQSLARVLSALIAQGYVAQAHGHADRRQRLLSLTETGQALERRLFERQRERVAAAYRRAGPAAVDGFRAVIREIMDPATRDSLDDALRPRGG
jgi:DNA-binding MarR family transcriptional regulator